jgi:undecaprenyl diphosphate synthase
MEQRLHIGIIPDGNRRWASRQLLRPWQGHEAGATAFRALVRWCRDNPAISVLTIWGFSTENWTRSREETEQLMAIYERYLTEERAEFHTNQTRFVHSGRTDRLPPALVELIKQTSEETKEYSEFVLHVALDYGGRDEIVRAAQKLTDPAQATEESFRQQLDHPELPDVDLVIRTSGEQRTSGFFIWQAAYAELMFIDKFFPDVTPADLDAALADFAQRQRRFGR